MFLNGSTSCFVYHIHGNNMDVFMAAVIIFWYCTVCTISISCSFIKSFPPHFRMSSCFNCSDFWVTFPSEGIGLWHMAAGVYALFDPPFLTEDIHKSTNKLWNPDIMSCRKLVMDETPVCNVIRQLPTAPSQNRIIPVDLQLLVKHP